MLYFVDRVSRYESW